MLNKLIKENLDKLNSMTKYPSIGTYHQIGSNGILNNKILDKVKDSVEGDITEKINGTNTRIILAQNDYVIGCREELLYSKGDRIINTTEKSSETLIPIADDLILKNRFNKNELTIVYGELYGGNIGVGKENYTKSNQIGYRIFDIVTINEKTLNKLLSMSLSQISSWRKNGGQNFVQLNELKDFCSKNELDKVPSLGKVDIDKLPKTIVEMYKFLCDYDKTLVGIDFSGKSEGIIVRSSDRKYIRKIRFEEYIKTIKKLNLYVLRRDDK